MSPETQPILNESIDKTRPDPWSQEANTDLIESSRPTRENPLIFDTEDAISRIKFSQVPGENLRGLVLGYFYNESNEKINMVALTAQSKEKSGFDGDIMMVPESAKGDSEVAVSAKDSIAHASDNLSETSSIEVGADTSIEDQSELKDQYDRLFDLSDESNFSVEDAAVRLAETEEGALVRQRQVDDASAAVNAAYKRSEMS